MTLPTFILLFCILYRYVSIVNIVIYRAGARSQNFFDTQIRIAIFSENDEKLWKYLINHVSFVSHFHHNCTVHCLVYFILQM
jgi:hypothetical protein